jgi:hypothetical protein
MPSITFDQPSVGNVSTSGEALTRSTTTALGGTPERRGWPAFADHDDALSPQTLPGTELDYGYCGWPPFHDTV